MKIKAQGFYPDILYEVLTFASRKELAKFQITSYLLYMLIQRHLPKWPYLRIQHLWIYDDLDEVLYSRNKGYIFKQFRKTEK